MQDWEWSISSLSAEQSPDTAESPLITNTLNDDPGEIQSLIGLMRIFDLVTSVVLNFSLYKRHSESIFKIQIPEGGPFQGPEILMSQIWWGLFIYII